MVHEHNLTLLSIVEVLNGMSSSDTEDTIISIIEVVYASKIHKHWLSLIIECSGDVSEVSSVINILYYVITRYTYVTSVVEVLNSSSLSLFVVIQYKFTFLFI